jgi:ATP phosphoribosyltransferase regulatory subunit HisZ
MPLDRYHRAVLSLADSTEHWKARLCNAANNILFLQASEFPKDLQERHASLLKSVTLLPGDNGAINASVYQMKEKEGGAAISEIVAIWAELRAAELRDAETARQAMG